MVPVTFYDPANSLIREVSIKVGTTLGSKMVATRHACQDYAADHRYPLFCIPADLSPRDLTGRRYLVFRMEGRNAMFVKAWPNEASAQMWMQLNG